MCRGCVGVFRKCVEGVEGYVGLCGGVEKCRGVCRCVGV